jgi:uncharacterized protein (TIGR01319 family)
MEGLRDAIQKLPAHERRRGFDDCLKLACSSAAGGLKIVAIGLVRELTAEAATRSSLGAGGRVVGTFAGGLTDADILEVQALDPDLIVLAGGTDGGNRTCIEENAIRLADSEIEAPIIVAGNRNARHSVVRTLSAGGKRAIASDNVLPDIHTINASACAETIRHAFMEHIVAAKGLDHVEAFVGDLVMPTPHAVLKGCELIAAGTETSAGWGDLVCVDIGGATTDVYSMSNGTPSEQSILLRGLTEPYSKRTVEGDLGVRSNAPAIVELVGSRALLDLMKTDELDPQTAALHNASSTEHLPTNVAASTSLSQVPPSARHCDGTLARLISHMARMAECSFKLARTYGPCER